MIGPRVILLLVTFVAGCDRPAVPTQQSIATVRPLGTWEGIGNRTIGITSDSGRFRVRWETREDSSRGGSFRLTVHSAVSGRPIQVIADHQGAGGATVDFADDPRPYNLMIDSADVRWLVSVDEIFAGRLR